MKNVESLFSKIIWKKGKEYYESGKIVKFNGKGNTFTALVKGTEQYRVSVVLNKNNNSVNWMSCSCPHAQSGANCKHMAAVLNKIIHNQLYETSNKNDEIILQSLFTKYKSRYGGIERYRESSFFKELMNYLDMIEERVISHGDMLSQIEYICSQLDPLLLEHEEYKVNLAKKCTSLLMYYANDEKYQRGLFSWLNKQCKNVASVEMAKAYVQIWIFEYSEENYLKINQLINNYHKNQVIMDKLLEEKIALMKTIGKTETEIFEEIKNYENYEVVFDFILAYFENKKQYLECSKRIARLLNNQNIPNRTRNKYIEKMNELALLAKDKKAYALVVRRQLRSWKSTSDKEIVQNFKNMFSISEWEHEKYTYLSEWNREVNVERYLNILVYLKEYKELFRFFFHESNYYMMKNYIEYLITYDEEVFTQLCYEMITEMAENATSKSQYHGIKEILGDVLNLVDGKVYVDDIILYLRRTYLRKRALMAVLDEFERENDLC